MKKRSRAVWGLNSAELKVHLPEWEPIRPNGAPFGVSSKSKHISMEFWSHSLECAYGSPESTPIRPNGASIWSNAFLLGLFSSFEALDAFRTLRGTWGRLGMLGKALVRVANLRSKHLSLVCNVNTLKSPKIPEISSKHHGDKNKVKSCVNCVKSILKRKTRHYNKEINVL